MSHVTFIHPTAVVDADVVLGEDTKVWHFCHVSSGARIGRGCVLGQNVYVASTVRVGDNVRVQNNVSLYDGVTLADDVFVGPSAVFTNVQRPRAAHPRKDQYSATVVGKGATIGANATIVCGVTLGEHAFIGAGAVVTHDVPAYALMVGNPARHKGWVCACGERLPEGDAPVCSCGRSYLQGSTLVANVKTE